MEPIPSKNELGYGDLEQALADLVEELRTRTAAAKFLDESKALVSHILNQRRQDYSLEAENRVRAKLGLPVIGTGEVAYCRTCGKLHAIDDCEGGTVIVLTSDKMVVGKPGTGRPRKKRMAISGTDAELEAIREEMARLGFKRFSEYVAYLRNGKG